MGTYEEIIGSINKDVSMNKQVNKLLEENQHGF